MNCINKHIKRQVAFMMCKKKYEKLRLAGGRPSQNNKGAIALGF